MPYCPECSASVADAADHCPTCGASLVVTPTGADEAESQPTFDTDALAAELRASLAPQYEVLKPLGVGGMGAVFLAREPALKRLVAVKVLAPSLASDRTARARFEREATAAAALSHPNVVRVYSVGETARERLPFIVMQYVDGATLAAWAGGRGRVAERDARRIIGEVAAALAAAHRRELVHRDVKPSNVLLEGETGRAYVADFGVSAALSQERQLEHTKLTATGTVVGTPIYMSPEQAAGEAVTPKSDVYSLGMLAYELVTGELPFTASSAMGWVAAHMRDTPTPVQVKRPDLSPEVLKLIDRCLAKAPADRPGADEVARGMLPSLETEIEWPPPGLQALHGRADKMLQPLLAVATAGTLALAAVVFTPDIVQVHPHWLDRFDIAEELAGEQLQLRATAAGETGEVAFFTWQGLLLVTAALFVLGLVYATSAVARTFVRVARARALGWDWETLIDVAVDRDGQSGLILSGTRVFASLDAGRRRMILQARRRRALAFSLGCAWPVAAVSAWAALAALGTLTGATVAPLAGVPLLWVTLVPAGIALVIGNLLHLYERRLMGPVASRRRDTAATQGDIAQWYGDLPFARRGPRARAETPARRWLRRAALAGGGLLAVVTAVGVVEIVVASVIAARFVQRTGPQTAELLATLQRLAETDPLGTARQAWQPYVVQPAPLDDSTARTLLRAMGGDDALPPYEHSRERLAALSDTVVQLTVEGGSLSRGRLAELSALGEHPRTAAYRRLAGARSEIFFTAPLDKPLDAYEVWEVPLPPLGPLRQAAHANALAALAVFHQGGASAALRRLGENLAVAERLFDSPTLLSNLIGKVIVQHSALPPLVAIEDRRGDASAVTSLREALHTLERVRLTQRGAIGLFVDPSNPQHFRTALFNPAIPPGVRGEIIFSAWGGVCGNPRELLTGPSARRLETVLAAVDELDLPFARELAHAVDRAWKRPWSIDEEPAVVRRLAFAQWSPIMVPLRARLCTRLD